MGVALPPSNGFAVGPMKTTCSSCAQPRILGPTREPKCRAAPQPFSKTCKLYTKPASWGVGCCTQVAHPTPQGAGYSPPTVQGAHPLAGAGWLKCAKIRQTSRMAFNIQHALALVLGAGRPRLGNAAIGNTQICTDASPGSTPHASSRNSHAPTVLANTRNS